jgi:hydrogenobyrinic acid a,c-diamide synthase (glutamine-hydrolysing) (EC 6.3.5.9)/cobyrinate a,c-diamide synthase (EC 6.3.5.-)
MNDITGNNKKNNRINGFYISAAKRNSGKTTISIAIMRLLRDRGLIVQPFKKGPDFIDPMWLSTATGKNCYNLDFYFMSKNKIKKHFLEYSLNSDVSIVEGNHGLHDSFDIYGKSSNAEMAKLLGIPVILLIDVGELNRGVVPLILGFPKL